MLLMGCIALLGVGWVVFFRWVHGGQKLALALGSASVTCWYLAAHIKQASGRMVGHSHSLNHHALIPALPASHACETGRGHVDADRQFNVWSR
jgi:hypothetical protein